MPNELREEVARDMAKAAGHDWDGKAKGMLYANHGHYYKLADAAIAAMQAHLVRAPAEPAKRHPTQIKGNCPRCGKPERTPADPDVLREALQQIIDVGGSYTTGEGHQECREIALAALAATEPTTKGEK